MNGFPQMGGLVSKQFDAVFGGTESTKKHDLDIEVTFCRKNGTVTIKDRTNKNTDVVLTGIRASNFNASFEQMKKESPNLLVSKALAGLASPYVFHWI
ncbi:hypothetical protein [Acinetobacter nosocomialis]|uniref:hypothetical protein n=1 Tax=Acinetobacter nosocomialis TaxID=106654 RepID=UPI0033B45F9C